MKFRVEDLRNSVFRIQETRGLGFKKFRGLGFNRCSGLGFKKFRVQDLVSWVLASYFEG